MSPKKHPIEIEDQISRFTSIGRNCRPSMLAIYQSEHGGLKRVARADFNPGSTKCSIDLFRSIDVYSPRDYIVLISVGTSKNKKLEFHARPLFDMAPGDSRTPTGVV